MYLYIVLTALVMWPGTSLASQSQIPLNAHSISAQAGPLDACAPQQVSAQFESAEHRLLGDALHINIDGINRTGENFAYPLGANGLSFGQIVALADFYSDSNFPNTCGVQISDPGLSFRQRQASVKALLQKLEATNDDPTALNCITDTIAVQSIDAAAAADPAQCFAARNAGVDGWDLKFFLCTPIYASTALCNWDHFGQDAVTAYQSGHAVALQAAQQASDKTALFRAYFMEAFAQHYLTDLFSAGHLRAPRRDLHSSELFNPVKPLDLSPGDLCNKYMHDEDSANGLWVHNARGEAWPIYGDKQLFASKSHMNRDQALNAMQASVDEVFKVYRSKQPIDPANYAALTMIPSLTTSQQYQNFRPMFTVSDDSKTLLLRTELNDRSSSSQTQYSLQDLRNNQGKWADLSSLISESGVVQKMYPRTVQRLTVESNLTQIRQLNETHLLINNYGPVWTRLYAEFPGQTKMRSWNMIGQHVGPIGYSAGSVTWQFAKKFSNTFLLIGSAGSKLVQVGIQTSTSDGLKSIWSKEYPEAVDCQSPKYTVGPFGTEIKGNIALIRSCGSPSSVQHEVYGLLDMSSPPSLVDSWKSLAASNLQAFVLYPSDKPAVYVETWYDSSNDNTHWSFTTFGPSYSSRNTTTFAEPGTFGNQHYLTDKPAAFGSGQRVIRIQYAPAKSQIKIDVLKIMLDAPSVQLFLDVPMVFDVTKCAALDWFLVDVNGDARNDLVGYCPNGSQLKTITFLQQTNGGFSQPLVTEITNDYAQDFTGDYLKHIKSFVSYRFNWYTQRPMSRNSIFQLFDNYGILGVRLLSPTKDNTQSFEPVGQYPAIAGQISKALGPDGLGFILDEYAL